MSGEEETVPKVKEKFENDFKVSPGTFIRMIYKGPKEEIKLSLPARALRKLLLETKAVNCEIFERIYEMEMNYQEKYDNIFKKRFDIINGNYVPTEAECFHPGSDVSPSDKTNDSTTGISTFWLKALKSSDVNYEIYSIDEPILKHLVDIRRRNKPLSDVGYFLEFHFSPNEYFENSILTKEYFSIREHGNPMEFSSPSVYKSVGCEIKWKDGKAPSTQSFFDYFSSNKTLSTEPNVMTVCGGRFDNDFEVGRIIKDFVIPNALIFFNEWKEEITEDSNVAEVDDSTDDDSESESEISDVSEVENIAEKDGTSDGSNENAKENDQDDS